MITKSSFYKVVLSYHIISSISIVINSSSSTSSEGSQSQQAKSTASPVAPYQRDQSAGRHRQVGVHQLRVHRAVLLEPVRDAGDVRQVKERDRREELGELVDLRAGGGAGQSVRVKGCVKVGQLGMLHGEWINKDRGEETCNIVFRIEKWEESHSKPNSTKMKRDSNLPLQRKCEKEIDLAPFKGES